MATLDDTVAAGFVSDGIAFKVYLGEGILDVDGEQK